MRRIAHGIALLIAAAALASRGTMPIDPLVILTDLEAIYAHEPRTDDLRITVETPTSKRIERLTVRTRPGEGAEITMGPLTLWTDLASWYAVHEDIPGAYVRREIEDKDVIGELRERFPPVYAPQLVFALGSFRTDGLCAYAEGLELTEGTIKSPDPSRPSLAATATARATSQSFEVTIVQATRRDGVDTFDSITSKHKDGSFTISARRVESNAPDKQTLGRDIRGRDRVESLRELLKRLDESPR